MLQEMYNTYLEQCSQLFLPTAFLPDNFSNVFNTIFEVSEEAPTFALQPEVCITPFISEKILKQAFNYDIPHSEEIIKQAALAFRGNMKRLTDSQTYVYFTADGLLQFAASGRTAEIPEVFIINLLLSTESRCYMELPKAAARVLTEFCKSH